MSSKKLWGGRFSGRTSDLVEDFTESVSFDRRLYAQDIAGSIAHARMLGRQGVLEREDVEAIVKGLTQIKKEIESGDFPWNTELEDVHMNIESRLTDLIGLAGKRLHTGRSRNDQVALDFRLYVNTRLEAWLEGIRSLISVLVNQAEQNKGTLLPGYTHLQPAQPVSLAQHQLAYAWMLRRDYDRLADCLRRVRVAPLGAAALAGSTYDLDPESVAEELGFDAIFKNSMDAVSDRDFVAEALFDAGLIMIHLSRYCEELIIWANPRFGFIRLPDAYATGSSIMPQKKNPDVAELIRGKTGRVLGALTSLLTLLKGLPLAYNRDMQEDKEPFFDADETVSAGLALMAGMVESLVFVPEAMRRALAEGFCNATELADYLVGRGAPFRDAHEITGKAVAEAESMGQRLEDLPLERLRDLSELIEEDVYEALAYETAVARRETPGGTGPESVASQIGELQLWLLEQS